MGAGREGDENQGQNGIFEGERNGRSRKGFCGSVQYFRTERKCTEIRYTCQVIRDLGTKLSLLHWKYMGCFPGFLVTGNWSSTV